MNIEIKKFIPFGPSPSAPPLAGETETSADLLLFQGSAGSTSIIDPHNTHRNISPLEMGKIRTRPNSPENISFDKALIILSTVLLHEMKRDWSTSKREMPESVQKKIQEFKSALSELSPDNLCLYLEKAKQWLDQDEERLIKSISGRLPHKVFPRFIRPSEPSCLHSAYQDLQEHLIFKAFFEDFLSRYKIDQTDLNCKFVLDFTNRQIKMDNLATKLFEIAIAKVLWKETGDHGFFEIARINFEEIKPLLKQHILELENSIQNKFETLDTDTQGEIKVLIKEVKDRLEDYELLSQDYFSKFCRKYIKITHSHTPLLNIKSLYKAVEEICNPINLKPIYDADTVTKILLSPIKDREDDMTEKSREYFKDTMASKDRTNIGLPPSEFYYNNGWYHQDHRPTCLTWSFVNAANCIGGELNPDCIAKLLNGAIDPSSEALRTSKPEVFQSVINTAPETKVKLEKLSDKKTLKDTNNNPSIIIHNAATIKEALEAKKGLICGIESNDFLNNLSGVFHAICIGGYRINQEGFMDVRIINSSIGQYWVSLEYLSSIIKEDSTYTLCHK